MNKSVEDCLVIGVDFSQNDADMMMVMRRKGNETYIINMLKNEEAREIYNKLIGNVKKYCDTCKHCHTRGVTYCMHPNHMGDYVPPYTVCDDYNK